MAPIQQVHYGSRDLSFGTAIYRPDNAGWNNRADVSRLAGYLSSLDPDTWQVTGLKALREISDEQELLEELEFLRDWFPPLRELYRRAAARNQVILCETL
jgi:hypothetical protein